MKKLLLSIVAIALLGCTALYYFSGPRHTCEHIIEPYVIEKELRHLNAFRNYTIEDHIKLARSPATIRKVIADYRLDELYDTDADSLQENILSMLVVERLPDSNKISIKVGAATEEKAQQLGYAIIATYSELHRERTDKMKINFITWYKTESKIRGDKVSETRDQLISLSNKFGIQFVDPDPLALVPNSINTIKLKPDPRPDLGPAQQTQYAIAEDSYLAELKELEKIRSSELTQILVSRRLISLEYHNIPVKDEISELMDERKNSEK